VIPFAEFVEATYGFDCRFFRKVERELVCACGCQFHCRVLHIPRSVTLPDSLPFSSCIFCNAGKQTDFPSFDNDDPFTRNERRGRRPTSPRTLKQELGGYGFVGDPYIAAIPYDRDLFTKENVERLLDRTFPHRHTTTLQDARARDRRGGPSRRTHKVLAGRWKVVLREYCIGRSAQDIGDDYGMSRESVKAIIHRARNKVSKIVSKKCVGRTHTAQHIERGSLDLHSNFIAASAVPSEVTPCKQHHKSVCDSATKESSACTSRPTIPPNSGPGTSALLESRTNSRR
jgi:hypothetical protein